MMQSGRSVLQLGQTASRRQQQQQQHQWQSFRSPLFPRRPQQLPRRRPYSSSVEQPPPPPPPPPRSSSTTTTKPHNPTNPSAHGSKPPSSSSASPAPAGPNGSSSSSSSSSATSGSTSSSSSSSSASSSSPASRFARVHARLPRFLQRYTAALASAPVSHVTAFLVLHEITAVVPVVGFGWYFYRAESLPWFAQGAAFDAGVRRFGNYFRRKGWLGPTESQELDHIEGVREHEHEQEQEGEGKKTGKSYMSWLGRKKDEEYKGPAKREKWWGRGENGIHLVTSFAAAYALTKILLPARLILSAWMTPFFARTTIVPITRDITNLFKKKK